MLIGSDFECTIRVDNEAIAPRHAQLEVSEDSIKLRRLTDSGTLFVNGKAIEESELSSGDEIRIGGCRWLLQAPGLRPVKVLTEEAVRRRVRLLPWLIAGGLMAMGLLAWKMGFLPF